MSEGPCHMNSGKAPSGNVTSTESNTNLVLCNKDGDEVGRLDFSGPGLEFEGVANESAIVFMGWISKVFQERLQEEYDRGFKDGKAAK